MPARVLIAEGEEAVRELFSARLRRAGCEVVTAADGREAMEKAGGRPDLILLDEALPDMSGLEVCRRVRRDVVCPILLLSHRGSDEDKLRGFAAGCDGYLVKPVSPEVLAAQVSAELRRARRGTAPASVRFDEDLVINYTDRTLRFQGREIPLARKEFDILALLSQNPGVVLDKERIYERVWGFDSEGDSATVAEHVRRVRVKLTEAGAKCPIETVWGCGYRWSR